jgi:hypothetical protein
MFSPKELVEHLADRRLQEGDAARVAGAVPGIRAVGRIMGQRTEEGRRQRIEIGLGLALDVAGDELRRVLEHVDEAMQFAQHVVRDVARGARLAVQEDGISALRLRISVTKARSSPMRLFGFERQLLVVDRQDEGEARLCCWAKEVRSP